MAERVLVVVPTYNERENVRPLLKELLAQGENVDVWVADDGSPDGTAEAVREVVAEHPGRVDLLLRQEKAGSGAAVSSLRAWVLSATVRSGRRRRRSRRASTPR